MSLEMNTIFSFVLSCSIHTVHRRPLRFFERKPSRLPSHQTFCCPITSSCTPTSHSLLHRFRVDRPLLYVSVPHFWAQCAKSRPLRFVHLIRFCVCTIDLHLCPPYSLANAPDATLRRVPLLLTNMHQPPRIGRMIFVPVLLSRFGQMDVCVLPSLTLSTKKEYSPLLSKFLLLTILWQTLSR